jgi:hypothetical protein
MQPGRPAEDQVKHGAAYVRGTLSSGAGVRCCSAQAAACPLLSICLLPWLANQAATYMCLQVLAFFLPYAQLQRRLLATALLLLACTHTHHACRLPSCCMRQKSTQASSCVHLYVVSMLLHARSLHRLLLLLQLKATHLTLPPKDVESDV